MKIYCNFEKNIKPNYNMAIEITDDNFQEYIIDSGKPAVLDFSAEWCGPCRILAPIIKELSKDYENKAVIGKVNIDNCPKLTSKFKILSVPTLIFLKNGVVTDKLIGTQSRSIIEDKLKAIL